jgi:isoquinoline 1-oxidoreductase
MSNKSLVMPDVLSEVERYELREGQAYHFNFDRREFFKIAGSGLVVLCLVPKAATAQQRDGRRRGFGGTVPSELGAWIHIGADSRITVYTGKVEIGQNIRTSLAQAVAEELRTAVNFIDMVMADTGRTPFDFGTAGSMSTPMMAPQLRKVGAAAREILLDLAAKRWSVERKSLLIKDGRIEHPPSNQSCSFGELTQGKKLVQTIEADSHTTPAAEWKIAGTSVPKVDGRAMVSGRHKYASDMKRPGMLVGKVLRPEGLEATLVKLDTKAAEAMPGVTIAHDGSFVGVAAANEQMADQALAAIQAEWKVPEQPSSKELYAYLKKNPASAQGFGGRRGNTNKGSKGLQEADLKLEATYTVAYIAHCPLEPRAALAEWNDGKLTVWTGTQRPFGVRRELATAFHLAAENVRVIVPDMGSGYGGKHTGEAALEAARLARAAGRPVQVLWTREEEFTWAYFRPAGVIDVRSGVRKDGSLTAWEFHNFNSGSSAIQTLYEVPNQHIEFHGAHSPLRQGSYRALAATANHFARESHMDELAHSVHMDPLEFRLKNLKNARLRAVLEAATDRFGWGKGKASAGRGYGLACGSEKGSFVATCAEVALKDSKSMMQVVRVVTAFDCGAVVNPNHLRTRSKGPLSWASAAHFMRRLTSKPARSLTRDFLNIACRTSVMRRPRKSFSWIAKSCLQQEREKRPS